MNDNEVEYENGLEFDDMSLLISCMELAEQYDKLRNEYRKDFINYIKGEYCSIKDEFEPLINEIIHYLEICKLGSELEECLQYLINKYDKTDILNVITSMMEYLNETLEYIEYNF